jgi:hypothetical protein
MQVKGLEYATFSSYQFVYFRRVQLPFVVSCIIDDSTYTKVLVMV